MKSIERFIDNITKSISILGAKQLFKMQDTHKLGKALADNFHNVKVMFTFVFRWWRLDVQTTVNFLLISIVDPNEDNWK